MAEIKPALQQLFVIDIETVPQSYSYADLPVVEQQLWDEKSHQFLGKATSEGTTPSDVYNKAGIWAEFGKIVVIAYGAYFKKDDIWHFKTNYIANHNEVELLKTFLNVWNDFNLKRNAQARLAGHNAKEFDVPYIIRRLIINNLKVPDSLQLNHLKPWETPILDSLHLWRFGDFKHYISLKLLAHVLGVASSKDDISGSQVAEVYYKEQNLGRIAIYCEKDVFTTAQIILRLLNYPLIDQANWVKNGGDN